MQHGIQQWRKSTFISNQFSLFFGAREIRKDVWHKHIRNFERGMTLLNDSTNTATPFLYLVFIGPCIVIYSYSTTNKMHPLSQIIYSCKTLYMFRKVFPSIIRSSKLRIQQRYMSNSCCYLLLSGMRWNSFISSPIAAGSSRCLTYTVAVYAVLSSWWWTERPSETCRAFYKNK